MAEPSSTLCPMPWPKLEYRSYLKHAYSQTETRHDGARFTTSLCLTIKVYLHTYLHHASHEPVLKNADRISESSCEGVHGPDVSDEQVLQVCGLSAHLGVKVQASWLQAALFDDGLQEIKHRRITMFLDHWAHLSWSCAAEDVLTAKVSQSFFHSKFPM